MAKEELIKSIIDMLKNIDNLSSRDRRYIERAVMALKDNEKEIIYFKYFRKLTCKRIELITRTSERTLRRRLKSALNTMVISLYGIDIID